MTIGNAMAFIKRGMSDDELRGRLNSAPNVKVRDEILSDERLQFSQHEFEEAFRNQLTLCQQAQSADKLREFKMWWELLTQLLKPGACESGCKGCSG
jgi:hypothetical protein